jgi:hypothetical protein
MEETNLLVGNLDRLFVHGVILYTQKSMMFHVDILQVRFYSSKFELYLTKVTQQSNKVTLSCRCVCGNVICVMKTFCFTHTTCADCHWLEMH